jgi:hypothetical protein
MCNHGKLSKSPLDSFGLFDKVIYLHKNEGSNLSTLIFNIDFHGFLFYLSINMPICMVMFWPCQVKGGNIMLLMMPKYVSIF